jgi:hypothetical protein
MTGAALYKATIAYERALAQKRATLQRQLDSLPEAKTWLPKFFRVEKAISKYWPLHWPLVEAQLTVCTSLLLENVTQSTALFAIGPSGSGKSTTLKMFRVPERAQLIHAQMKTTPLVDEQDDFSIPAFLSHYSELERGELEAGALAFTLKHRVMLTSELGPIFRGNREALEHRFTKLAQILDGEGIRSSSGVHGTLGQKGDFTFVWLGGTTPFRMETWKTMASLGTRLLFFTTNIRADTCPEELFAVAQAECQEAIADFLTEMFSQVKKRSVKWPDVAPVRMKIRQLAELCAIGQAQEGGPEDDPFKPSPGHFRQRLMQLACAHAILLGRKALSEEDLPMLRHITMSSMPSSRGPILLLLMQGASTAVELSGLSGLSEAFVRKVLDRLGRAGVLRKKIALPADRWEIVWDR